MYVDICIYVYIYTERERERDRQIDSEDFCWLLATESHVLSSCDLAVDTLADEFSHEVFAT